MKMVQTISLLWDSPSSHERERLWLLKLGDKMLCPYIIQTASFHVAVEASRVRINPQQEAATNPPIQGRKTVICVQAK